ncbi:hypothetical protein BDR26DRAFT_891706 [Obelidium mucronatum]|nr:hypothetical protein BDR26DRAFT_891706 [Obelidium mucronatum]
MSFTLSPASSMSPTLEHLHLQAQSHPSVSSTHATSSNAKAKCGRKLDPTEPANKRVAQCRAAQRAFRERKAKHSEEMQLKIQELSDLLASSQQETYHLRHYVYQLERELADLRGGGGGPFIVQRDLAVAAPHQVESLQERKEGFWNTCL